MESFILFIKSKISQFIFITALIVLFTPSTAYAYLDPGSGSALFTSLIAIAVAAVYSIKSFYYKLLGKNLHIYNDSIENTPILFSEGKVYWGTFEPIVLEFIQRKIHFRYISLDVLDPALEIESEYMHSKLYTKSRTGFGKISLLKAPLLLATTPNIGCDGYPMERPKKVMEMMHVFHHLTDSSPYRLGSLDFFDSVVIVGSYQEKYLRHVEKARNIKIKELLPLGLPYFDNLYQALEEFKKQNIKSKNLKKNVLIAPSWGNKSCFNYFGIDFVKKLAKLDIDIVIRLHPHSLIYEPEKRKIWIDELDKFPNISWDQERLSTKSMFNADILISDTSSVRFDFALLHLKPVITLDIPQVNMEEFESSYHETTWSVETEPKLGAVITKEKISTIPAVLENILENYDSQQLLELRNKTVANLGFSAKYIVDTIDAKCKSMDA